MQYSLIDPMSDVLVALGNFIVQFASKQRLGKIQLVLHGKIRVTDQSNDKLALSLLRATRNLWSGDARCGTEENEMDILETLCKEKLPPQVTSLSIFIICCYLQGLSKRRTKSPFF